MKSVSIEDLWDCFVSGDNSCFCKLYKFCYEGLYGYGLKLYNHPELVEDCIQELFISIWERRRELSHITSPNVYLYVSLRRKLLKLKKKQKKNKREESRTASEIHFGIEELIIRDESKKEQREKLQKVLNQLPNRQKEVIYLHFYNGMSYGEIEEILSINRQSVRNLMYRTMETLRTVLDTEVMRLVILVMTTVLFPIYWIV